MNHRLQFLLFVFLVISQNTFALPTPQWTTENVDRIAPGNRMVQLAFDKKGQKHLVYTGCSDNKCESSELYHAKFENNSWVRSSVDSKGGDTGWFPSISFDANSFAHIFYADHDKQILKYASNQSSRWAAQKLGEGRGGWWTSSNSFENKVFFAHTKLPDSGWDGASLEVGTLENGKWNYETVDGAKNAGWFTSMAVLPNGNPVVSYSSVFSQPVGSVKVAVRQSNRWEITSIDNNAIKHHVAVDSNGKIHVVYQKLVSSSAKLEPIHDLMYATNSSGTWKRSKISNANSEIIDSGYFPRLTVDSQGGIHIAYTINNDQLTYARKINADSSWEFYTVEDLGGTMYPWIEVEKNGDVHIAFERGGNVYVSSCTNCKR